LVRQELETVRRDAAQVGAVWRTLQPDTGPCDERRAEFDSLHATFSKSTDPIRLHMAKTMASFAPGLFAGGDDAELPADNYDLERAFRVPKSHERHIHGRAHAGVRIVQQGPTLLLVLDAHQRDPSPLAPEQLMPYLGAPIPPCQLQSEHRRKVMRLARSSKRRHLLLDSLERRYQGDIPLT
jgi:hypothetical protein